MRRNRRSFHDEDPKEFYWPSFTDMMSMIVLVILFISIIAFVQAIYQAYEQTEIRNELAKVTDIKRHISNLIKEELEENVGKDNVTQGPNNTISIEGDILFESASAEISAEGEKVLASVGKSITEIIENEELSQYIYIIMVEGHTDKIPYDNWTLSTERAVAVVKYMIESNPKLGAEDYAKYLAATGYSEFKPVAEGSSPDALQQNRRISFQIILDDNKWQSKIKELTSQ